MPNLIPNPDPLKEPTVPHVGLQPTGDGQPQPNPATTGQASPPSQPTVVAKPQQHQQPTKEQLAGLPTEKPKPVELAKVTKEGAELPKEEVRGKMLQCNCWVKINKNDSVELKNVTPMEMLFLVAEHNRVAGGNPIHDITLLKDTANRTPRDELMRLRGKYNATKLGKLWPGAQVTDIGSFEEAQKVGVQISLGKQNLIDHEIR